MYPNRSTCRQIQDSVAGYKIHVARYKIHAGYMLPATCIRQHVASVYRALPETVVKVVGGYLPVCLSVRPSVRLSVTRWY